MPHNDSNISHKTHTQTHTFHITLDKISDYKRTLLYKTGLDFYS